MKERRDNWGNGGEMRGKKKKKTQPIETRCVMLSIKFISQLRDLALDVRLAQIFLFSSNGKHSDK